MRHSTVISDYEIKLSVSRQVANTSRRYLICFYLFSFLYNSVWILSENSIL